MLHTTDGLSIIASKSPVVATHVGGFNEASAKQTQQRYVVEASTYVRPNEITIYQEKFLERLLNQKTSIGCIVAPFGYGKTSTAIDTWRTCEQNGILAIPPFSCGSVAEMGNAIATGVVFQLGIDTIWAKRVNEAYEAYLVSSARRLAEQDVEVYKIEFNTALRSIEDKIERGFLQIEATGSHLLGFLEQITQIVVDAGYKGLLIIVDEFQQFLGNINKAVITNFRTLVWGMRTRGSLPLGLLITMDPDTERNLAERAGDILHRIKEDSLYLDFTDTYDREFARLLWAQYKDKFNITKNSHVVDNAALDAIGQICERHDLSNGPRTVIDIFQRIAKSHDTRQRPYNPIDLIDDFMTGSIRFDGDRSKIASLVTELTSYEYIKGSQDRLRTLKLISAFPKGCPKEVAESYELGHAYEQLTDALRGEVLTELPEGIALIDLQRVGKPQNKLNIILKKYWMQITEDEIVTDKAVTLFTKYVLSPLFPPFRNILSGWISTNGDFQLSPNGGYFQIYDGSFFEEYPRRRVWVEVCRHVNQVSIPYTEYDVRFVFLLQRADEEIIRPSYNREDRSFTLGIVINQPFRIPLPRDVRWIEDYLRPVVMSPAVVLSLIDYISSQAPKTDGITENELQRIEMHSKKLNDFLVSMIFGENLFEGLGVKIISRGEQVLRHVLFHVFREAFPGYNTLITSPQWEVTCRSYVDALKATNPIYTRGIETLTAEKAKIAALFGFRNHAGFESQVRQFGELVSLENWAGDQGSIRFQRHPGEDLIIKAVTIHKTADENDLLDEARKVGYLPEETLYLLEFLELRGYLEKDTEGKYRQAQTLSKAELKLIAKESTEEAQAIIDLVNIVDLSNSVTHSQKAIELLQDGDITEAQIRILQYQKMLQDSRPLVLKELQNNFAITRSRLYEENEILKKEIPVSITGLQLDSHINGAQRSIFTKCASVTSQVNKATQTINSFLASLLIVDLSISIISTIKNAKTLQKELDDVLKTARELTELIDQHKNWILLVDRLRRIKEYIHILEHVLDVNTFLIQYDAITDALMERLSIQGINLYLEIYREFSPQVYDLYSDVTVAIKATEIKNTYETTQPEGVDSAKTNGELLDILLHQSTRFVDVVQSSGLSSQELIDALVQLESNGLITLKFEAGKKNG